MTAAAEKIEYPESTAELMIVDSSPATISVNYEAVKAGLEKELKKYDVVVTADTVADAKKLATELNKNATEFNRLRKEAVEKVSGPIRLFEDQMKDLSSMCKDGRQKILDQVKVFEDKTLAEAKAQMQTLLEIAWSDRHIDDEFKRATIDDMVKLGAVTGRGNLTAKVKSEVISRAQADKALQDQTNMRLLVLENQSYKAGLAAPLTRAHVEAFLFADDAEYQLKLDNMLESEKQRQTVAEEVLRENLQKEAAAAVPIVERELESMVDEVVEDLHPEPAQAEIITLPIAQTNQAEQTAEYAYGPMDQMSKCKINTGTFSEITAELLERFPLTSEAQQLGIWTREGRIATITVNVERHIVPIK